MIPKTLSNTHNYGEALFVRTWPVNPVISKVVSVIRLWGLNELIYVKYSEQFLAYEEGSRCRM